MEPLRWILLIVGAAFVIVIYLLGRSRRRRNSSIVDSLEDNPGNEDSLPEFSARNLDDLDEGVGEVRIITGAGAADAEADFNPVGLSTGDDTESVSPGETAGESAISGQSSVEGSSEQGNRNLPPDIVVLFILPKADKLLIGSQINSAAQAMGLTFGEMNIFHYRPKQRNIFGLANMLEPGSFDAETIHDLKTSGLTVFMQITGDDPLDDLTEMLQRSYQLAGLLDARLCNHKREPLTEQDAENYRTQVRDFIASKSPELASET